MMEGPAVPPLAVVKYCLTCKCSTFGKSTQRVDALHVAYIVSRGNSGTGAIP